ncbi:LysR substrate-binding domain-containing protein [Sphingosinicella sp. CPCC 101087]|uniref:LysR substrate-binding domain-containing protein n=1 Tax=Sphingosinicella sp. CPCC 101087 TaxID=2497754 RepID=UPI00101C1F16|nr:LysR substrate-binding domain-containing protein [Sphingosinicella sp. CPCC 101087]
MHSSNSLPPLEGLNALLAAADAGSFTAAAEALGITHGSVSRRVAALESWLGTSLFERHGRGVRLTPAGQRFAAEARRALGALARSAEHWRPWRGRQTVSLSVVPAFARLWLLPRLAGLERDDLHVNLLLEHRATHLDAREADIAIRYGRGAWDGVDARLLFRETLVPAAAPEIAARLGRTPDTRTAADLLHFPLLHDSDVSQWRAWLDRAGIAYRPRWNDRRFEDYDTVLAAAASGLGIALLRLPFAASWLADGRLVPVAARAEPNPAAHHVCLRVGESRSAVLELAERLSRAAPEA